jgi:hypothetical protein
VTFVFKPVKAAKALKTGESASTVTEVVNGSVTKISVRVLCLLSVLATPLLASELEHHRVDRLYKRAAPGCMSGAPHAGSAGSWG